MRSRRFTSLGGVSVQGTSGLVQAVAVEDLVSPIRTKPEPAAARRGAPPRVHEGGPAANKPGTDKKDKRDSRQARRVRLRTRLSQNLRLKAALILSDLTSVSLAATIAFLELHGSESIRTRVAALSAGSVVIFLVVFAQQNLYNSRHISRRGEEFRLLVNASALGTVCVAALAMLVKVDTPRTWLIALSALSLIFSALGRELLRRMIQSGRSTGKISRKVVLVGNNREAQELHEMLSSSSELGYDVVGRVSDDINLAEDSIGPLISGDDPEVTGGAPWLGTTDRILDIVRKSDATGVVVATTDIDLDTANWLVRTLTSEGIYVEMSSAMRDIASRRVTIRPLGRYPVMTVEPVEQAGWRAAFKRCFDIAGSLAILLALSPVLLVAMVAIRATSGKGVFFRQSRVGRFGEEFTVLKLRTMVHNAEDLLDELWEHNEAAGPMFKMADDPRVTRVGGFLRRTSLDEIPQFFNVIMGHMSLVGPRPALPSEALQWNDELRERLRVKPGITGNWQINGRFTASLEDYQRLDMFYVDNWSIVTDLVILAKTVPAVLRRNGAA